MLAELAKLPYLQGFYPGCSNLGPMALWSNSGLRSGPEQHYQQAGGLLAASVQDDAAQSCAAEFRRAVHANQHRPGTSRRSWWAQTWSCVAVQGPCTWHCAARSARCQGGIDGGSKCKACGKALVHLQPKGRQQTHGLDGQHGSQARILRWRLDTQQCSHHLSLRLQPLSPALSSPAPFRVLWRAAQATGSGSSVALAKNNRQLLLKQVNLAGRKL
jgi:hypothetical protein